MAKKDSTPKRDSKTGRFVAKKAPTITSKGKKASTKARSPSKDKVGTNSIGAKNKSSR